MSEPKTPQLSLLQSLLQSDCNNIAIAGAIRLQLRSDCRSNEPARSVIGGIIGRCNAALWVDLTRLDQPAFETPRRVVGFRGAARSPRQSCNTYPVPPLRRPKPSSGIRKTQPTTGSGVPKMSKWLPGTAGKTRFGDGTLGARTPARCCNNARAHTRAHAHTDRPSQQPRFPRSPR